MACLGRNQALRNTLLGPTVLSPNIGRTLQNMVMLCMPAHARQTASSLQ